MATIFWDVRGILFIEYMPKGTTINANVYANTLKELREAIDQKRPDFFNREVFRLHDHATVHKAAKIRPIVQEFEFVKMDRLPYSPDLAPPDFYLFRLLKKNLRVKVKHFL
jgi:histone-lysine N-methyltransferase SETMAR